MTSIRPLAEVADIFNGKTPSKTEQRTEGHPVLKIKDVSATGSFKGKFESFVDPTLAAKHQSRWVRGGDTLILNAAHNADYVASKIFFAGGSVEGAMPTGEWLIVRAKPELVLPAYIHFLLRSPSVRKTIKLMVKGIHLYPKDVATLPVPIPSLAEQRRIVDLLTRAEGIVRLRREAEKKAAELIPALFIDLFGDPVSNPKGWPVDNFGTFGQCRLGKMLDKKKQTGEFQRPYLRNANVQWDRIDIDDLLTMNFRPDEQNTLLLRQGDVLICEGGEIGRAAVWHGQMEECYYQKALHRLRPDLSRVRPDFVVWLLWHLARSGTLLGSSTHATIAHLTGVQLKNLKVISPPAAVQVEFERQVEQCHSIQSQQSTATAKAEATFNALLAQVFSMTAPERIDP